MVSILVEMGADVAGLDKFGAPPWFLAMHNEDDTILAPLISDGFDVNAVDSFGNTLSMYAAQNPNAKLLAALVAAGADVSRQNVRGTTACHHAAKNSNELVIASLLGKCDPNLCDRNGNTPAMLAAANENANVLKLLMTVGANVHAKNNDNVTPCHFAAKNKCADVLVMLLAANVDVNTKTCLHHITPLHEAASVCNVVAVKALIARGADVNAVKHSRKVIELAIECDDNLLGSREETLRALVDGGANVNMRGSGGNFLHLAAKRKDCSMLKVLIDTGGDVNARDSNGYTPSHCAVDSIGRRPPKCLELLLSSGRANVNLCAQNHRSILVTAVIEGSVAAVKLLIAAHADVNLRDIDGWSATDYALRVASPRILTLLLSAGALMYTFRRDGCTVCHVAAEEDRVRHLRALIRAGVDVNVRSCDGRTPVHNAGAAALRVLLAAGADLNVKNDQGVGPVNTLQGKSLMIALTWGTMVNGFLLPSCDKLDALTTFAAVGRLSHIDCRTGPTTVEALVVAGGGTGETSPELSRIAVDRACIAIARRQWEALRLRALLVCIGLQSAQLSALEMCEILANAFAPLELLVPFHKVWAIATTVKHFPR